MIYLLKVSANSKRLGELIERDIGLESIIGNIYQSFACQDIYEEKGAIFLYLIAK